jgi:hypothetical protein
MGGVMELTVRLLDLPEMHPNLLWDTIIPAAVTVLSDVGTVPPHPIPLGVEGVPGFGSRELRLLIDPAGVPPEVIAKVSRTYEPSRMIELAAIAVAAIGLHGAGRHQILDVARRGSGADYLVDETSHHLEIAGRSRRRDLDAAWQQKRQRLADNSGRGFYVCVAEFESPSARLAFLA